MKIGEKKIYNKNGIYNDIWNGPIPDFEDLSEIVISHYDRNTNYQKVLNLTAGISGKEEDEVVSDGKFAHHYICGLADKKGVLDWTGYGFYLYYNKVRDVLVIYEGVFRVDKVMGNRKNTYLHGEWQDIEPKFIITKDVSVYVQYENEIDSKPFHREVNGEYFDYQSDYFDMTEKRISYKATSGRTRACTSYRKSVETLKEFFGQASLPFVEAGQRECQQRMFSMLGSLNAIAQILGKDSLEAPPKEGDLTDEYIKKAKSYMNRSLPDVDKRKILEKIGFFDKKDETKVVFRSDNELDDLRVSEYRFGFVQHVKGKKDTSVLRVFDTYVDTWKNPGSLEVTLDDIEMYEAVRIYFSKEEICACYHYYGEWLPCSLDFANQCTEHKTILINWSAEDAKGTILSVLDHGEFPKWCNEAYKTAYIDYQIKKIGGRIRMISANVLSLITNPYSVDVFYSPFWAIQSLFKDSLEYSGMEETLNTYLDSDMDITWYPKKASLMDTLKFPKRFLTAYENVLEKYFVACTEGNSKDMKYEAENSFRAIMQFFRRASDEEKNFVNGINTEQFQDLLETWTSYVAKPENVDSFSWEMKECVGYLVDLCGIKNLKNYITYVYDGLNQIDAVEETDLVYFRHIPRDSSFVKQTYYDYLQMYYEMTKAEVVTEKPCWRFKDFDTLKMAHDDILYLVNINEDRKLEKKEEKYSEIKEKYEKYKYAEDSYTIIPPSSLVDIINEGIALNHCVKTYVDKVIEEKTNILFVRRMEKPEKPFYTLEVRDDVVRQCHGFNNCNISEEKGLEEFLKRYCEEKNIKFNGADRVLAVGN